MIFRKYRLLILVVFLFLYGCGSSSSSTVESINKDISFFAWDGIDGYDKLSSKIYRYNKPTIYLNPVDDGVYKFEENTQLLQGQGFNVWYLMSADPTLEYVQNQVDIIVKYNKVHTQKVLGMSFDIEPWVNFEDQNSSYNQEAWQEYLDFMSEARDILHKNSLKISISIPFWIDRQTQSFPNDRAINYDIIDIADEIIVMTYTVFADRIEVYAKTSLEYASSCNKDIKIALEMVKNTQEANVSFYTHPEDIKDILYMDLNYNTFKGYTIHTLKSFLESGIEI